MTAEALMLVWFLIGIVSMQFILKAKKYVVDDKLFAYQIMGAIGGIVTTAVYFIKYKSLNKQ